MVALDNYSISQIEIELTKIRNNFHIRKELDFKFSNTFFFDPRRVTNINVQRPKRNLNNRLNINKK